MSASTIKTILAPGGLQVVGGAITQGQGSQAANFPAITSSNTGGNLSFNVPSGIPWLTNPGSGQSAVALAAGQYVMFLFCTVGLGGAAGGGAYGDIGISQGGSNIMTNRYNFNGFPSGYLTNMNASTSVTSDGTNSTTVTAFCNVGNTTFNTSTPNLYVRIVKVG